MSAIRTDQAPRSIWGTQAKAHNDSRQASQNSGNTLLWVVSLASLTLNILIIGGFIFARGLVGGMVAETNQELFTSLNTLESYSAAEIPIQLSQSAEVIVTEPLRIQENVSVPLSAQVEINQLLTHKQEVVVPVRQTIPIRQTAYAPISVMGVRSSIAVPISFDIPVNFDMVVPIDIEIPFQASVPVETDAQFELNKEVSLPAMTVDVQMDDTVSVPFAQMMEETSITDTLYGVYKILNVIENVLMIPLPK